MAKNTSKVKETKEVKEKAPTIEIIRGRMALPLVYMIRFQEEGSDSEIARKYRTTVGKVSDVKKVRNFAYIVEGFVPTQEMVDACQVRCNDLDEGESIMEAVNALGIAGEDDLKAFEESKAANRKVRAPKKVAATDEDASAESAEEDLSDLLD
jgi:hypothetical protein